MSLVTHAYNLNLRKAEAEDRKLKSRMSNSVRSCLKKQNKEGGGGGIKEEDGGGRGGGGVAITAYRL